eukprot:TRINITY_DN81874_c0_g1_i1.p1 TRINITY_DN81874_c0_g1~~TRINITY_DN81874_c0_g1_i1.p1  ORF type:complete len:360 (-),score=47.85 TRINITY_DN81874_c0_g1_i1:91-1170(-)
MGHHSTPDGAAAAIAVATTGIAGADESEQPVRVGLIADVQYADAEDGSDYAKTEIRHFRNALKILSNAVKTWNAEGVDTLVQLGDIIDGINSKAGQSEAALQSVLNVFNQCTARRRFDLVGNHELYNFSKEDLPSRLNCTCPSSGKFYYSAPLSGSWEAIFLDPYEIALMGLAKDSDNAKRAVDLMEKNNPNVLSGGGDWFDGLPINKHRWVPYNGAVADEQLQWLRTKCAELASTNRFAIVFTHIPLVAEATQPKTVTWNTEDILSILHEYRSCVVAVIAGHDHGGGYAVDDAGLHHITLNSPMTATPGEDCFAILELYKSKAVLQTFGRACVESATNGQGKHYPQLVLAKGAENKAL